MIFSDESYCSDSNSDVKPDSPISSNDPFTIPSKPPVPNPSGRRRPIPIRSSIQNQSKLPAKKALRPIISNSSIPKKKIENPIDSESSSYYDYESESDNEEIPIIKIIPRQKRPLKLAPKKTNRKINTKSNIAPKRSIDTKSSPRKSSLPKQQNPEKLNNTKETSNFYQNDHSSSSSNVCELYEDEVDDYQDTNEEPQLSEQTLQLLRRNIMQSQSQNENIDTANILDDFSKNKLKYRITCTKTQFSSYTFHFFSGDQFLMKASSSNTRKYIDFKVPEFFEDEDITMATMSISKNRRQFSLCCNGNEVMSTDVSSIKKPFPFDAFYTVNLKFPDTNKREIVLRTKLPKVKSNEKFSKKPIRHVTLINNNDKRLIIVKKITESKIEIDASPLINDDLLIFAFGVISWIRHH